MAAWPKRAGHIYREGIPAAQLPGVVGILAAGNHLCVAVRDILDQLLVHNNLVIIKMNPCNDWTGPQLQAILAPLVDRGFLHIVYGAAPTAQVRCVHLLLSSVLV